MTLSIALFGCVGVGKSSVGNAILNLGENDDRFHTEFERLLDGGVTKAPEPQRGTVKGQKICITDGRGINEGYRSADTAVWTEAAQLMLRCREGVDIFLIVFRSDDPIEKSNDVLKSFMQFYGPTAKHHVIFVFTHADMDNFDETKESLCGIGRLNGFSATKIFMNSSSTTCSNEDRVTYVDEIMQAINTIVTNNNGRKYHSNDFRRKQEEHISEIIKQTPSLSPQAILNNSDLVPPIVRDDILTEDYISNIRDERPWYRKLFSK